jgi:DNA polymerase-4
MARKIGIKLRFDDFKTVTRDLTLASPVSDATAIRRAAGQCLKRVDLSRSIRLLGVKAAGLMRPGAEDQEDGSAQFGLPFD